MSNQQFQVYRAIAQQVSALEAQVRALLMDPVVAQLPLVRAPLAEAMLALAHAEVVAARITNAAADIGTPR